MIFHLPTHPNTDNLRTYHGQSETVIDLSAETIVLYGHLIIRVLFDSTQKTFEKIITYACRCFLGFLYAYKVLIKY